MSAQLTPILARSSPTLLISKPVILIGRHRECDFRIDSPQVSRRHCCVAQAYDRLIIRDLGSRHGIRVNGRVVDESVLKDGDEVAIAQIIYRLELPKAATLAVAPNPPPRSKPTPEPHVIDLDDDFIPLSE